MLIDILCHYFKIENNCFLIEFHTYFCASLKVYSDTSTLMCLYIFVDSWYFKNPIVYACMCFGAEAR